MNESIIKRLQGIVGAKNVIHDKSKLQDYSHDEFPGPSLKCFPEVVVKPKNAEEVSKVLKLANEEKIAVTPRGGGTGLCGGCVPAKGGIALSLEKLNKIIEVDKENLMVVIEAGALLKDLYVAVEKEGLFFPPHPGDDTAQIGGVIATNAGGSRAIKHGTIRNFVRGLEVVLPNGEITNLGGKIMKNSSGFNLIELMIGSEGTLGVITKATISLLPPSKMSSSLIIPFDTTEDAIGAVPGIRQAFMPLAIEFIELDAIEATERHSKKEWPVRGGKAYLFIIVDGPSADEVEKLSESIAQICLENRAKDVFVADSKQKQKEIMEFRSHMYEALKPNMIEDLDVVVPMSEIAGHVKRVHEIEAEHGLWLPTYGHAGDGNAHTHIMNCEFKDGKPVHAVKKDREKVYPTVRDLIHEDARKRGGMVSGEHGIGLAKKEYLPKFLDKSHIQIMKSIKSAIDPNDILNPGKIV